MTPVKGSASYLPLCEGPAVVGLEVALQWDFYQCQFFQLLLLVVPLDHDYQ